MEKELKIVIKTDAKTGDIKVISGDLKDVSAKAKAATTSTSKFSKEIGGIAKVAGSLYLVKQGFDLVRASARWTFNYADTYTNINSRLSTVVETAEALASAQTDLFDVAQLTRTELSTTTNLYTNIKRSVRDLNMEQSKILQTSELINKTGLIGGGGKESINAALVQLSQGLAANALRGEELNSVMEQTPRLAMAISDGMGVGIGDLRAMAEEGKITTEVVINSLLSQTEKINAEFAKLNITSEQANTHFGNSLTIAIGELNEAVGLTKEYSELVMGLSNGISGNKEKIVDAIILIKAAAETSLAGINYVYEVFENSIQNGIITLKLTVKGLALPIAEVIADFQEMAASINLGTEEEARQSRRTVFELKKEIADLTLDFVENRKEVVEAENNSLLSVSDRIMLLKAEKKINEENLEVVNRHNQHLESKSTIIAKTTDEMKHYWSGYDKWLKSSQSEVEKLLDLLSELPDEPWSFTVQEMGYSPLDEAMDDFSEKLKDKRYYKGLEENFKTSIENGVRNGIATGIATGDFGSAAMGIADIFAKYQGDIVQQQMGGGLSGAMYGGLAQGGIGLLTSVAIDQISSSGFFGGKSEKSPQEKSVEWLQKITSKVEEQTSVIEAQGLAGTARAETINELKSTISKELQAIGGIDIGSHDLSSFDVGYGDVLLNDGKAIGNSLELGTGKETAEAFYRVKAASEELNSYLLETSRNYESLGYSLASMNEDLNGTDANLGRVNQAMENLGIYSRDELASFVKNASDASVELMRVGGNFEDLTQKQKNTLTAADNFGDELSILKDFFKEGNDNLKTWNDSFKTQSQLLVESYSTLEASGSISSLPTTFEKLDIFAQRFLETGDGISDAELTWLTAVKSIIESTEEAAVEIEETAVEIEEIIEKVFVSISDSSALIKSDIVSQANAARDLASAYKNVQNSITQQISSLTDEQLSFSDVISKATNFTTAKEAQAAADAIGDYYSQQADIIASRTSILEQEVEQANKEREAKLDLLEKEDDVIRSLRDFGYSLRVDAMMNSYQTDALKSKFYSDFADMERAVLSGDSDMNTLASRAISSAKSYLESYQTTAASNADYLHVQSVIANMMESYDGAGETAMMYDLRSSIVTFQDTSSKDLEDLKRETIYALNFLNTNTELKAEESIATISDLIGTTESYLGEGSDVVSWLQQIVTVVENISFEEFVSNKNTANAYNTAERAQLYLATNKDVNDAYHSSWFTNSRAYQENPNITALEYAEWHYLNYGKNEGRGWYGGGYTGDGNPNDFAGFVHKEEYVMNAPQVKRFPDVVKFLEDDRKGFKKGGFTSPVALPGNNSMQELIKEVQQLRAEVQQFREESVDESKNITRNTRKSLVGAAS